MVTELQSRTHALRCADNECSIDRDSKATGNKNPRSDARPGVHHGAAFGIRTRDLRITRPWGFVTAGSGSCHLVLFCLIRACTHRSAVTPCVTSSKGVRPHSGRTRPHLRRPSRQNAVVSLIQELEGALEGEAQLRMRGRADQACRDYQGSVRFMRPALRQVHRCGEGRLPGVLSPIASCCFRSSIEGVVAA